MRLATSGHVTGPHDTEQSPRDTGWEGKAAAGPPDRVPGTRASPWKRLEEGPRALDQDCEWDSVS